jgi:hypothetical protein
MLFFFKLNFLFIKEKRLVKKVMSNTTEEPKKGKSSLDQKKEFLTLFDLSLQTTNVLMILGAFLLLLSNFVSIGCLITVNSLTPVISTYYYNGTSPQMSPNPLPDTDWVTWTLAFGFVFQFFLVFLGIFA